MDQQSSKAKRSWLNGGVIFGAIFVLAGLLACVFISGPQVVGYFGSASWQAVPTSLMSIQRDSELHRSDGKTTRVYSLRASYSYQFRGAQYVGSQITLDDSFDSDEDYWRQLESQVRNKSSRSELQAWVNPSDPQEALLDRSFRWFKAIIGVVFLLIFGGAGCGVMWLSTRKTIHPQPLEQFAEGIKPQEGFIGKVFFFIAAFILLVSVPLLMLMPAEVAKGKHAILFVLMVPLIGLGFLYHGFKTVKNLRLFGPALLKADPLPGCAGGQVGGSFDVSADSSNQVLMVHLECVKITRGRKSSHRSLIWQDHQQAFAERGAAGSKHTFCFDVPNELPATDVEGRTKIQWLLRAEGEFSVNGDSQPFKRTWEVPVIQGVAKTADIGSATFRAQAKERKQADAKSSANEQISLISDSDALQLISRSGRNTSNALVFSGIGGIFASIGFALVYFAWVGDSGSWFIGIVFSLIGSLIVWGGIWSWGRKLEVVMQADELWLVRSLFGKALYQRTLPLPGADDIQAKSIMTSTASGQKTVEYFALVSHANGKKQKIAESIEGRHAAEALLAEIQAWIRSQHSREPDREADTV